MNNNGYGLTTRPFGTAADAVAALCAANATWVPHDQESTWWLFASGPAGYVTGVFDDGLWHLTNQDRHHMTGLPAAGYLAEIRIFKPGTELRLFRMGGIWRGSVREPDPAAATPQWLQPRLQRYLIGRADWTSRLTQEHASVVRDQNNGQSVVVPVGVPDGRDVTVSVQEYFGVDDATGAVRVVTACWQEYSLTSSSKPKKKKK